MLRPWGGMMHTSTSGARRGWLAVTLLIVLTGCGTIPPKPGFDDVEQLARDRTGMRVQWNQGRQEDAATDQSVDALLREGLTADAAVQIALLNNPSLQADYERLGVAQADLVQAGLLINPVFGFSVQRSSDTATGTARGFSVTQDFLNLFTRLPRKQMAAAGFEKTRLEVSQMVVMLAAETRAAYHQTQALTRSLELYQQATRATQAAADLAGRQYEARTLSKRDHRLHQSFHAEVELAVAQEQVALLSAREHLNRLMGLWGRRTDWRIAVRLADPPSATPLLAPLESHAIAERIDLAVLKRERDLVHGALQFTRDYRYLSALGVGYGYEKDRAETLRGPSIELGLPLFDRSQGTIARLESQRREIERKLQAKAVHIRSEVREAHGRLAAAHAAVGQFRDRILPLQQDIVGESQKFYNGMLIGVYDLLRAKQDQINAGREYVRALGEYWQAHVALEKALGGRWPRAVANP